MIAISDLLMFILMLGTGSFYMAKSTGIIVLRTVSADMASVTI